MGGEKWISALEGALLAFCIAFGGCGCLVSAFDLEVPMATVALCCGLCAILMALCFAFHQWVVVLCGLALVVGYLWQSQRGARDIEALLYQISKFYNEGYGWGIIRWSGSNLTDGNLTVGICLAGGLVALVISLVVCCRGMAWLGILAALAPLCACLVVVDTVPEQKYLFLLLLGVLLLLLTQTTRRKSAIQGARLLGMLTLPAALALAALFWAIPQEGYAGQENAAKAANAVVNWAQGLTASEEEQPWQAFGLELDASGLLSDRVDLSQIGPQTMGHYAVMTVTAPQTGPLYLRGCSFDTYDGKSWMNAGEPYGEFALWPEGEPVGEVTVTTRTVHPVMYFPYYPGEVDWQQFTDGKLDNTESVTTYSFTQLRVPDGYRGWNIADGGYLLEPFLALPDDTRAGAEKILARIFPDGVPDLAYFTREAASAVAAYVGGSAVYDLGTKQMPGDAEDFALWFLEESDTGYCVHFATAATVLLRAAGIPARYVTGYLVDGKAGKSVTVRAENAHAWVEFYVDGVGWTMLEPTPAAGGDTESTQPTGVPSTLSGEQEEPSQAPDETVAPQETEVTGTRGGKSGWELYVAWAGALAVVVIGQWRLRLCLRRRRQHRGEPNAQALARWQETVLLSRLLEEMPDKALLALAQKAKYSQHTITPEELAQFDAYLTAARNRLRQRPLLRRLIDRLVYAAY